MQVKKIDKNFTELEMKQMKTIGDLQEKIKLLEFDNSKSKTMIRELKTLLLNKQKSIREIIKELEKIIKNENYGELYHIRNILNIIERQGMNNEQW